MKALILFLTLLNLAPAYASDEAENRPITPKGNRTATSTTTGRSRSASTSNRSRNHVDATGNLCSIVASCINCIVGNGVVTERIVGPELRNPFVTGLQCGNESLA